MPHDGHLAGDLKDPQGHHVNCVDVINYYAMNAIASEGTPRGGSVTKSKKPACPLCLGEALMRVNPHYFQKKNRCISDKLNGGGDQVL